jgi:hypothetical protein
MDAMAQMPFLATVVMSGMNHTSTLGAKPDYAISTDSARPR